MHKIFLVIGALLLTPFPLMAGSLQELLTEEPEFLPADEAFQFDYLQEGDELTLVWQIENGYYLYRKQFRIKSRTAKLGKITFPKGEMYEDAYFGETEVYYHQVRFQVPLLSGSKDAEVTVRYQGCAAAGLCYPPKTRTIHLNDSTLGP